LGGGGRLGLSKKSRISPDLTRDVFHKTTSPRRSGATATNPLAFEADNEIAAPRPVRNPACTGPHVAPRECEWKRGSGLVTNPVGRQGGRLDFQGPSHGRG